MTRTIHTTAPQTSTQRLHVVRASASILWAVLLSLAVAVGDWSTSVPASAIALLVAYPIIDVVASLAEARMNRDQGSRHVSLVVNTAISLVTAAALGLAAGSSAGAALQVFGIWALLTGLIQLGSAVARRRRGDRGQWPLMLSGSISALAGIAFVQMGGRPDPALTVLAGYAVAGAVFLLVSVYRQRSRRHAVAG